MTATENLTPPFVVGEIVTYSRDNGRLSPVRVVGVEGTNVTVDLFGNKAVFAPRPSDGVHVRVNSPDFAAIYRRQGVVKKTLGQHLRSLFSGS